jgi:predicted glycosyltransferase
VKIILLPRNAAQRSSYGSRVREHFLIPSRALDGPNLIAASDLVISAGGTMNREAAALGTPAATIYAGRWAAVDEELCESGRLVRISNPKEFSKLPLIKKASLNLRRATKVKDEVVGLILE